MRPRAEVGPLWRSADAPGCLATGQPSSESPVKDICAVVAPPRRNDTPSGTDGALQRTRSVDQTLTELGEHAMEVQLISNDRNTEIHRFVADARPVRVGRRSDNDVRIRDPQVSRYHCQVEQLEHSLMVRDLDSSNGTFVNGLRITEAIVKSGDRLTMANTRFTVSYALVQQEKHVFVGQDAPSPFRAGGPVLPQEEAEPAGALHT